MAESKRGCATSRAFREVACRTADTVGVLSLYGSNANASRNSASGIAIRCGALAMRKVKGNVKGSGQECPLYTSRRENARDSCESRAGWYRVETTTGSS